VRGPPLTAPSAAVTRCPPPALLHDVDIRSGDGQRASIRRTRQKDLQRSLLVIRPEQMRRSTDLTATPWEDAHNRGAWWPLEIPTYDGDPSVGHPSVVLAQDWNGYRYWMAFPPEEVRRAGYRYNSDPELVLTADGQMLLYYRPFSGGGDEATFCTCSQDGVTRIGQAACARLASRPNGAAA